MANITAKDLHDLIFNDGRLYGDDGANHLCNYTDEQRIQLIEEYAQSKLTTKQESVTNGFEVIENEKELRITNKSISQFTSVLDKKGVTYNYIKQLTQTNEGELIEFINEFVEAWEDGNGGDTDLYRKAKTLQNTNKDE